MKKVTSTGETINPFIELPQEVTLGAVMGTKRSLLRDKFKQEARIIIGRVGEMNPTMGGIAPAVAVEEFGELLGRLHCKQAFGACVPQWRDRASAFYQAVHRLAELMDEAHAEGVVTLSIRALEANAQEYLTAGELEKCSEQLYLLEEVLSAQLDYYV